MSDDKIKSYADFISGQVGALNEETAENRVAQINKLREHHLQQINGHETAVDEHQMAADSHRDADEHLLKARKAANDPVKFKKHMDAYKKAAAKADSHSKNLEKSVKTLNDPDYNWAADAKED